MIGAGDPEFDRERSVFNSAVDRRPVAIARCTSPDDVVAALGVRAERGLPVAVRGAGTSDRSAVDDGLVIDVSPLKRIEVDPASRTARVGGGVTWAELDLATEEHGLAVTGARLSGLGVAGVALGDGSGWLERALGPTGADLLAAELVLGDGRVIEASEEQSPELLWALRGAGAGFGVVTRIDLRLHAVEPTLLTGFLSFPRARALEVARGYREFMREAPDQVGGGLLLGAGQGGSCNIVFCFVGPIEAGQEAIGPLRELGPSMDAVAPNPYRALQCMRDAHNPRGTRVRLRGGFLPELSDECLEVAVARADMPAASLSHVFLQPLGGAVSRADPGEMAFRVPDADWAHHCVGLWPPIAALDAGNAEWVDGLADALEPYALGAVYPSLIEAGGGERAEATYGSEGYERLGELKGRYDPDQVFRAGEGSGSSP